MKHYYTIPFDVKALTGKQTHSLCELKDSIRMNINLIIKTHYNEYYFDRTYGCLIWNLDYDTITNLSKWKDDLKSYLANSITRNEPRLQEIKIGLDIGDAEFPDKYRNQPKRHKKKITIQISGIIRHLNEPFEHVEHLYFSPLSVG